MKVRLTGEGDLSVEAEEVWQLEIDWNERHVILSEKHGVLFLEVAGTGPGGYPDEEMLHPINEADPMSSARDRGDVVTISGEGKNRDDLSAAIVQALDQAVASARTIHDSQSIIGNAPLGPVTHFIVGAQEWQALVLAIRKAESDA